MNLPPQYTPQLAAQTAAQPDWYFLWIYQILKISIFEGPGLPIALSVVTLIFIVLILLPFLDRNPARRIAQRPKFVTLGVIFVAELVFLAYWGLITPGQIIPLEQAILLLGGIALIISLVSLAMYRVIFPRARTTLPQNQSSSLRSVKLWNGGCFAGLAAFGAIAIGGSLDAIVSIILFGATVPLIEYLVVSILGLAAVFVATAYLLYRSDLGTGLIKRRVRVFEKGWLNDTNE